ncbi:hypothetical protein BDV25DRAFT_134986 [Aspergillus avenaceus]|uniref:Uncharacterized protein n=1 Tax=Aspergillus avenaceus TaxID=36643 RepID=A0A5N6U9F3_ASPAV|nr:hypothetical protein BDV25DRAFT_134986 [Aspergillus avenaceus]
MTTTTLSLKDLVGEMTGNKTTNGYDVLVAYTQSKVNDLLKARADSLTDLQTLGPFTLQLWDLRKKEYYPMVVNLKVKSPVLKFQGVENVILRYDVESGNTKIENNDAEDLPAGLVIELTAKLSNVSGTVNAAGEFTETTVSGGGPASVKPPGYKVVLNQSDKQAAQGVCIDMKTVQADVKAVEGSTPLAGQKAEDLKAIRSNIANHFQEAATVKYYLAGVSNTYAGEANAHILRPVSFNFTIAAGGTDDATLCMWIEVSHGANNGTPTTGQSSATFHPKDKDRIPLATGSTGSVILSHDIVWDQFLKPNLDKSFIEMKAEPSTSEAAYKATGQLNTPTYFKAKVNIEKYETLYSRTLKRDEIAFWPRWPESTISINRGIAKSTDNAATIAYKSGERTVNWSWSYSPFNGKSQGDAGTAYLTYSWGARGKWTNTTTGDHPNTISMEWDRDAHWTITGRAKEKDGFTKFAMAMSGNSTDSTVPADLTDSTVPGPNVNLTMNSLDYFLTTNLICPGKHMFKAHAIGKDDTKGLAVPHDLIITGDIDTSAT